VTVGFAATDEAAALIARTARHFAHKVPVTEEGDVTVIETRFGAVTLVPEEQGIRIELRPLDAETESHLRDVVVSHLERFARSAIAFDWDARHS
jgi:cytochrome b561